MTNLLHRIDEFVTVHHTCSLIPTSITVHIATVREDRVFFISVNLPVFFFFFVLAAVPNMRTSNSSGVTKFLL